MDRFIVSACIALALFAMVPAIVSPLQAALERLACELKGQEVCILNIDE